MRQRLKWFVVLVTVIAMLAGAVGEADGRRCRRRRPRCRRPRPPAPAPIAPAPNPNQIVFDTGRPIPDTTSASSGLTVPSQGLKQVVDVNVIITGLNATVPDNLSLLLSKGDANVTPLMGGVGGTAAVSNVGLTFDDEASRSIPDEGRLIRGTYKPATVPASFASLTRMDGVDPAGTWTLSARGTSGSISGWSLALTLADGAGTPGRDPAPPPPGPGTETRTFTGTRIVISDLTFSQRLLPVSGLEGRLITDVVVRLNGLTHGRAEDIDLSLASPTGQEVTVLSDAGTSASGVNLTFSDAASDVIPRTSPLQSGTWLPTDYDDAGNLFLRRLSAFDGRAPNGTWSLQINDDSSGETGVIESWELVLTVQ